MMHSPVAPPGATVVPPSSEIGFIEKDFDADGYRAGLRAMTDAELLAEGKLLHRLVYPRTVSSHPCTFEVRLKICRDEWRRRKIEARQRGELQ